MAVIIVVGTATNTRSGTDGNHDYNNNYQGFPARLQGRCVVRNSFPSGNGSSFVELFENNDLPTTR